MTPIVNMHKGISDTEQTILQTFFQRNVK